MPPDVFLHYLDHEHDPDLSSTRSIWLPRLPKRLHNGVVHVGEAAYGWGIYVIEGPNREVVFCDRHGGVCGERGDERAVGELT